MQTKFKEMIKMTKQQLTNKEVKLRKEMMELNAITQIDKLEEAALAIMKEDLEVQYQELAIYEIKMGW